MPSKVFSYKMLILLQQQSPMYAVDFFFKLLIYSKGKENKDFQRFSHMKSKKCAMHAQIGSTLSHYLFLLDFQLHVF